MTTMRATVSSTEPRGGTPLVWSVAGHALALGLLLWWPHPDSPEVIRTVMTVSLTGAEGPRTGGLTDIGGSAPVPVRPTAPSPAAPAAPKAAAPKPAPSPPRATERAGSAASRPPSTPTPSEGGAAPVVTGARGQGFGLSSSGGGSSGPRLQLDVSNFCCQAYLDGMVLQIQRGWNKDQGVPGTTIVTFTIRRDGTVDPVSVRQSSGFAVLDSAALRAVNQRLPPLPAEFSNPTLTIHITFEYPR